MRPFKLTVRNYRCLEDRNAAVFDFGEGFTAFVGQNNCGKSSVLKMFYEFRSLFEILGANGNTIDLFRGNAQGLATQGVLDISEVFCDRNTRRLELQFDITPSEVVVAPPITRALLVAERTVGSLAWSGQFLVGPKHQNIREFGMGDIAGFAVSNGRLALTRTNAAAIVDCEDLFKITQAFAKAIYIGPFRNAINQGSAPYFDITVGNAFVANWDTWKTGASRSANLAINRVTEDVRHIFGLRSLEIAANPEKSTLHLNVDGRPYKLNEVGAGLSQFVLVLGNALVRRPQVVLIDEPELNLHPSLQIDFLTTLASYCDEGVVFATHSLGLARSVAERIHTFRRKGDAILVSRFEQTPDYAEFLGEMSFSGFKELGFETILLVEGVEDVKTCHQFLRKLNKDHQVVVIPLGGDQLARGGVEQELAEFSRFSKSVFALVDSERAGESAPPARRRDEFRRICEKLGYKVCVTDRPSIENYLTDAAVKTIKGPNYSGLKPFQKFDTLAPRWSKSENWQIARAMPFDDVAATDVGRFFQSI